MQNILIVCGDKELRKDISKILASKLQWVYVDVENILDFELLNQQNVTMREAGDVLKKLEQKCINRALGFDNCVITISRDLFVSNDNFLLLKNLFKVFIPLSKSHFVARTKREDSYRVEQELVLFDKINKLTSVNCDVVLEKGIMSIEEICQEIIKKLPQK